MIALIACDAIKKSTQKRVLSVYQGKILINLSLLRCLHMATSSELLFKVVSESALKRASFSAKRSWQCIAPLLYGLALQTINLCMTGT